MKKIRFEKYWEKELINTAKYIIKLYNSKVNNRKAFILEKKIMLCLLHIRQYKDFYFDKKRKYPQTIELARYPIRDKKADEDDFGRRYILFGGEKEEICLKDLCNYFIHVNIKKDFVPAYDRLYGMFFTSDKLKNEKLYYINLMVFAEILLSLVKNEEIGIEVEFGEGGKIKKIDFNNKWQKKFA